MLPCYVVGDLPPDVLAEIDELVAEDDQVAALVADLRDQQDRAVEALCRAELPPELAADWPDEAPEADEPDETTRPEPTTSRTPLVLALGALVAAATIAVFLAWSLGPGQRAVATVPSVVYAHETAMQGNLDSWAPDDPALQRAFASAGVPEPLRAVPDLTEVGLEAEAVYIIPGQPPGSAVAYVSGDEVYLCQMWLERTVPSRGSITRQAGDLTLHGYRTDDVSLVMWNEGGLLCVMSADVPLDELLALAERRVLAT